jgi:hypothetical protein
MVLASHQVNNVLRVFGEQLCHNRISKRLKHTDTRAMDRISISEAARREGIIEKIATNIVDRTTQYGPHDNREKKVSNEAEEHDKHLAIKHKNPYELIFKEIDEKGETINALAIEDSAFLSYKLKETAIEAIDKDMV